jgi:hypothetical protein
MGITATVVLCIAWRMDGGWKRGMEMEMEMREYLEEEEQRGWKNRGRA